MDALDAAVRASLAAVRASVKDVGDAAVRAAVDARLASLASTMRPPTEAPPTRRAARRVHVQTHGGDGAAPGVRPGPTADRARVDVVRRPTRVAARQVRVRCPRGLADSYEVAPSLERAINATMERALAAYSERLIETVRSSVAASATSRG